MRIVLLHFLDIENKKYSDILKKLADTASKNGHQIDVVNGMTETDSFRITPYDYAAVVCAGTGFFSGKIPSQVAEVLAVCGTASGKKGCACKRRTCAAKNMPESNACNGKRRYAAGLF